MQKNIGTLMAVGLLFLSALSALGAVPTVHAASIDLSSWCYGTGRSWSTFSSAGILTCTVYGPVTMSTDVTIAGAETLVIPTYASGADGGVLTIGEGVTLTVSPDSYVRIAPTGGGISGIVNQGTINVDRLGNITIESNEATNTTDLFAAGIQNTLPGTLKNNGTIKIANTGTYNIRIWHYPAAGIYNDGTLINNYTITVENSGFSKGIFNQAAMYVGGGANLVNRGSLIDNEFFRNDGTITNYGQVNVTRNGLGLSLLNMGTIDNYGGLWVSNAGSVADISTGISNGYLGTMNNYGTITINDNGTIGIDNYGTIVNSGAAGGGSINIENSGLYGISNEGTISNPLGTITVTNTGADGIYNYHGLIINSPGGAIFTGNLHGTGILNVLGNITNYFGTVGIGDSNSNGAYGIYNKGGVINNRADGVVAIKYLGPSSVGILNYQGTITNNFQILLKYNSSASVYGIWNNDTLVNECYAVIYVYNSGGPGIYNQATIINSGTIYPSISSVTEALGHSVTPGPGCGVTTTTTSSTASSTTASTTNSTTTSSTSGVTSASTSSATSASSTELSTYSSMSTSTGASISSVTPTATITSSSSTTYTGSSPGSGSFTTSTSILTSTMTDSSSMDSSGHVGQSTTRSSSSSLVTEGSSQASATATGSGVPEFPLQPLAAIALTAIVAATYLAVRHRPFAQPDD